MSSWNCSEHGGSEYTVCPSTYLQDYAYLPQFAGAAVTPSRAHSQRSNGTRFIGYINSATYIERLEDSDTDIDDCEMTLAVDEDEIVESKTRICTLVSDPELVRKRQETYNKWLENKKKLERERKLREKQCEQEQQKRNEEEFAAKCKKSAEKVKEWMSQKCKSSRDLRAANEDDQQMVSNKKKNCEKDYQTWLNTKEKIIKMKKQSQRQEKQKQEQLKSYKKTLSSACYQKWVDVSKDKPKPVPLNRGFDSLAGSTTCIYYNPNPWQDA